MDVPGATSDRNHAMPPESTFPGVYIEEVPTGPKPIEGVSTSLTAFIGRTPFGPREAPTQVRSLTEFETLFGALAIECPLTYAVAQFFANGGTDALIVAIDNGGQALTAANLIGPGLETAQRGLWAFERAPRVNLIIIPPLAPAVDVPPDVWNAAIAFAARRRAFVIVDPPSGWRSTTDAVAGIDHFVARDSHAAVYFPRIIVNDPRTPGGTIPCPPAASVAGVYARTDRERGVWKAPAGKAAKLRDAVGLELALSNADSGQLNSLAVNTIRQFSGAGRVVWGVRTLEGADDRSSEWKYINVRRLFLYIEESIEESIRWAVFEPNDEALWLKVTQQVASFLLRLWRAGAFQGATAQAAFFVHCDRTTMMQNDIDNGRTIVEIGVAPVRPAEFVIVRIQVERS
jgi:phage tail sheath protein FI